MWYLYVIATKEGSLYAGITTDVKRRFNEHATKGKKAAKYLCCHTPRELVFSTAIGSRSLALKVEYQFKQLSRNDKLAIITQSSIKFDAETGKILK